VSAPPRDSPARPLDARGHRRLLCGAVQCARETPVSPARVLRSLEAGERPRAMSAREHVQRRAPSLRRAQRW
jgi:hypothetical protein